MDSKNVAKKAPQILAAVSGNLKIAIFFVSAHFFSKSIFISIATFGAFSTGLTLSWTSPALPVLSECGDNCALDVDLGKEAGSWVASILNIGCVISCLITGYLMSVIGRKWTLLLMVVPFTVGWTLLLITVPLKLTSPWWFYAGRFLTGEDLFEMILTRMLYRQCLKVLELELLLLVHQFISLKYQRHPSEAPCHLLCNCSPSWGVCLTTVWVH